MLLVNCLILSIIILYFGHHAEASGNITLLNSTNTFLEQDVAVFNCSLDAGPAYVVTQAGLSVNGSACISSTNVNMMYPRIRITNTAINPTSPPAEYTISPYLLEDSVTQYSCCAADNVKVYYTDNITLLLAVPPSEVNITYTTVYDSGTNCTITLTWPAVASDRAVTGYEVLQNGTSIGTPTPMSMNSYNVTGLKLTQHYANYTVIANSSTGSSMGYFIFTPLAPAPPSAPSINYTTVYDSATSCNGTNILTWPAFTSDRAVTGYEVLQNGVVEAMLPPSADTYTVISMTSLLTYTGRYTVRSNNCTGSSVSNEVVFSPLRVSAIDVTSPVLAANGNLTLSLIFTANRTYSVNYTIYAITNFTNGSSDRRDIYTTVQNSATLLTLAIPLPYLVNSSTSLLLPDVQNVSVILTVHSQCSQVLTLSSGVIPVEISSIDQITTTIATTTIATTTTSSTTLVSSPSTSSSFSSNSISTSTPLVTTIPTNSAPDHCTLTGCIIPIIIVVVIILLAAVIIGVVVILVVLYCRNKSSYKGSTRTTDTKPITGNESNIRMTSYQDDMPVYSQVHKEPSTTTKPKPKPKPNQLIYAEMDFHITSDNNNKGSLKKVSEYETLYSEVHPDSTDIL